MTRALTIDGTYWRVKYCYKGHVHNHECFFSDNDNAYSPPLFLDFEERPDSVPEGSKLVRIRPRMSIVRAVRLLVEARKQGMELWMRRTIGTHWIAIDKQGTAYNPAHPMPYEFIVCEIEARWIVATPSDARKIDAKRGGQSAGGST